MAAGNIQDSKTRSAPVAVNGNGKDGRYVQQMFSDIAPRYDLLNHLLSFSVDRWWRRKAISALGWRDQPAGRYLDLCAGTLDVAKELSRQPDFSGRVVGADFAEPMLRAGRHKVGDLPVYPVASDALALPLPDASCAGVVVAFGIRNVADLDAGLRESARVLVPGGRLVILEFNRPRSALVRWGYQLYFHHIVPRIGGLLSGNHAAYRYLPESVARFPGVVELAERMRLAGFREVSWESLTLGIAALHVGTRSPYPAPVR